MDKKYMQTGIPRKYTRSLIPAKFTRSKLPREVKFAFAFGLLLASLSIFAVLASEVVAY